MTVWHGMVVQDLTPVAYESVCLPNKFESAILLNLDAFNRDLHCRQWWKLINKSKVAWIEVLSRTYLKNGNRILGCSDGSWLFLWKDFLVLACEELLFQKHHN